LIDQDNNQLGVVGLAEALNRAHESELDLVEVAPNSSPPVCRIMDYGKWVYEQKRKQKENRKKSKAHSTSLKEIRLRPETEKHDIDIKVKKAHKFLEKKHRVQFSIFFRGRQMMHQEIGDETLQYITESLEDVAKMEQPPKMMGKRMIMLLAPKS
jgi:translation initiation factor IF-3